jgi:hypothetical protein
LIATFVGAANDFTSRQFFRRGVADGEEATDLIIVEHSELSARLLTVNRDAVGELVSLDAHPLLREYFTRRPRDGSVRSSGFRRSETSEPPKGGTTSEAYRAAHRRLYHRRDGELADAKAALMKATEQ